MLDKELQILLKLSKNRSYAGFEEGNMAQVRRSVKSLCAAMGLPRIPAAGVEMYQVPTADGRAIDLRLYRPDPAKKEGPALLYFHGGGFALYDLDDYDSFCSHLAVLSGVIVISVEYGLTPEHPFPTAYADATTVMRWVVRNLSQLRIRSQGLAVGGDSAGASLAIHLAASPALEEAVSLQLLIYPLLQLGGDLPSYTTYGTGYFLDRKTLDWFREQLGVAGEKLYSDLRLNPYLNRKNGPKPPMIIAIAEYDILRDEGIGYYQSAIEAGREAILLYFDDLCHNFILMAGRINAARLAVEKIARTLAAFFSTERNM